MNKILFLNSHTMGNANDELGKILIRNFLITAADDKNNMIQTIYLVNSAVKLACEGSHVLDALNRLIEHGAKIYSCGTCLDFFNLKSSLKAGVTGNMKQLFEALSNENNHIIRP